MATTKTKEELVRMAWITALRQQGDRQCVGQADHRGGVCAMRLLADMGGRWTDLYEVGEGAGLSRYRTGAVIRMNDRGTTFSEIADVVESWFATDKAA